MAGRASIYLFLFLLFPLTVCSTGTLVGFYYDARRDTATKSHAKAISFLKLNMVSQSQTRVLVADHRVLKSLFNTNVSVDLFLNETKVEDLKSKNSAVLWLESQLLTSFPHVKIKSVVVSCRSSDFQGHKGPTLLLSTLKSIHSILESFNLHNQVKVSVALSLSFLENLDRIHERDLHRIISFLKKVKSYIILETDADGELSFEGRYVQSVIKRATSILRYTDVSMVLAIKNTQHTGKITGLFVELSAEREFEQKELKRKEEQMEPSFHRELMNSFEFGRVSHDLIEPPMETYPTTPITNPATSPVITPPDALTPTVITVPATNPVTITPTNPVTTPVTVPSTMPITTPSINPVNSPLPVSNPVTSPITVPGAQPITNPVTTYPSPTGNIPVTTPVTTPVTPPAVTNSPAIPGQTWCTAKTGASQTALQAALDYACGIGRAECSMIQQGASCYNPNTLQNHASYAFNSYYQKNPSPTSCDFGGTAMVVNTNPSTGSCIYPSSSSSLTSTPSIPSPTPTTIPSSTPTTIIPSSTPTPTTSSSPGAVMPVSGSPPTVLNTSNPASATTTVFGSDSPPGVNTSVSMSACLRPFVGCIFLATSLITGKMILEM